MGRYFPVSINATRNALRGLPAELQRERARVCVKLLLVPQDAGEPITDTMIPGCLVSATMVDRFLEITPPVASIMPEFQQIINEIEKAYVSGEFFSATSAACVSIERLLNLARIKLHAHHPKIKHQWGKGASNAWDETLIPFTNGAIWMISSQLSSTLCIRMSGAIIFTLDRSQIFQSDALKSVNAAYRLLTIFLGFPEDLFDLTKGIGCLDPSDPRFKEFYLPELKSDGKD